MKTGDQLRLAVLVLLAACGGVTGAAAGGILGFGVSVPAMVIAGALFYGSDPLALGLSMMIFAAVAGFIWTALHSYRQLTLVLPGWRGGGEPAVGPARHGLEAGSDQARL